MRTWIKTIVNKFAISYHTALILGVHSLRSYLKLICEYELHSLPNKKVSGANDHGKNYIKVRPPLVRHLLRNRLLSKQHCAIIKAGFTLYRTVKWSVMKTDLAQFEQEQVLRFATTASGAK